MVVLVCFQSLKILNDRSAEQETAGMTLRITTPFPKFQRALWPKKIGSGNKIFGYIQTEITYTIFFRKFDHRCRAHLKPFANFENILRTSVYRAFYLNSE